MLMEQPTVTNLAVICGLCAMKKTLNQQCMLAQARHPHAMINHLTSIVVGRVWLAGLLNM